VEREGGEVQGLGETALPPVPPAIGNALYSRGIHVTELPISAESVLDAVDTRDGKEDAWAKAGSEPISTDGLSEQGLPGRVKRLLTSPFALLPLGTLGAGLLVIVLYRLLHRRGKAAKKAPSVSQALRR
jgi:hypothetical protein